MDKRMIADIIISIVTGMVSSIISSFFFWKFVLGKKPIIEIADKIANEENQPTIKFINRTDKDLIDIKIEMRIQTPFGAPNGNRYKLTPINLKIDNISSINAFDKSDPDTRFAVQIGIVDDIIKNWSPNSEKLLLRISATHSESNVKKVFEQYYTHSSDIKIGTFCSGDTFDIK